MKFIKVITTCTALVEETWTLEVPDNTNVTDTNALDLIGGRYTHSVTDRVIGDEGDRQVESVRELSADEAPVWRVNR